MHFFQPWESLIWVVYVTETFCFLFLKADTAGAVSIATISEKTAGTKIEISPLRYMIETSVFFHCTHICHSNIIKRGSLDIFNRFVDM
jgi:hypothetical protein